MNGTSPSSNPASRQTLVLAGWLALCLAASGTAVFVSTGGWYAGLNKPSWNPPAWGLRPEWTLLYVVMAIAAWLVWREGGWKAQGQALGLFLLQWLLNALWTPLFFGMYRSGLAFVEIVALWLVLAASLVWFWRVRRAVGVLLLPYLAWVSFAAALNFIIWRLNPRGIAHGRSRLFSICDGRPTGSTTGGAAADGSVRTFASHIAVLVYVELLRPFGTRSEIRPLWRIPPLSVHSIESIAQERSSRVYKSLIGDGEARHEGTDATHGGIALCFQYAVFRKGGQAARKTSRKITLND